MAKKKKNNNMKMNTSTTTNTLFCTNTIIDINEFKLFQKFYLNKFNNNLLPKIIMIILTILAIVLCLLKENVDTAIMVGIFMLIYPFLLNFSLNLQMKKMYKKNKKINVLEEKINFYDNYFESKSVQNCYKVSYSDIFCVCETKTNFYIFINKNQAFIIVKNNLEDLDRFRRFISKKANYRKYR